MAEPLIRKKDPSDVVIALVGNPNVGKSTIFNALTGLNQHTGNWPGKTVAVAQGRYTYKGKGYILVDLPGTYSLLSQSEEERVAVEFILSGQADCTLVLGDATCLERNLNLILQVMQITDRLVLCVNLLDEAKRRDICVDLDELERLLGIPVVGTSAGMGQGISTLQEKLRNMAEGFLPCNPRRALSEGVDLFGTQYDAVASAINDRANVISRQVVCGDGGEQKGSFDRIALGRWSGGLLLLVMLFVVFWLTVQGANIPSQILQGAFDWLGGQLRSVLSVLPPWVQSLLLDGVYTTDPRIEPKAQKLEEITYDEMLELASQGAGVLHNRSVELAKKFKVDMEVVSSLERKPGTKVKEVTKVEKTNIAGVAKDTSIARVALIGLQHNPGVAFQVFDLLSKHNINVDVILQSIGREDTKDITFTIHKKDLVEAENILNENKESLKFDHIESDEHIGKVSIVGVGLMSNCGVAAKMFEALYEAGINIQMINTSEIRVSVLLDEEDVNRAVKAVHAKFFDEV